MEKPKIIIVKLKKSNQKSDNWLEKICWENLSKINGENNKIVQSNFIVYCLFMVHPTEYQNSKDRMTQFYKKIAATAWASAA